MTIFKAPSLVLALAAAIGLAAGQGPDVNEAHAQSLVNQSNTIADVTAKVLPSVVSISTSRVVQARSSYHPFFGHQGYGNRGSRKSQGLGSGVIVSSKGYVLTNNHVIEKSDDIKVILSDGRKIKAKLVGADAKADLAVLKLQGRFGKLTPLPFGNSNRVRLGEVVLAVGNPMGVGQSVTMGIVSAKGRANMGIVDYEDFIQTDASINPGNSGGALVNLRGELVGIPTAIVSRSGGSQGIGFAIPASMARPIMNSLIKDGRVSRGYLGVGIQDIDEDLKAALNLQVRRGALITHVEPGSPAKRSGLRRNDVVTKMDGRTIRTSGQLRNRIASAGAKSSVALEVFRNGRPLTLNVKLGELGKGTTSYGGKGASKQLGVQVAPVSRKNRNDYSLPRDLNYGVVVTKVDRNSKAAAIGVRRGDVILEINRMEVKNAADLGKAYNKSKKRIALLIWRDGMTSYLVINK